VPCYSFQGAGLAHRTKAPANAAAHLDFVSSKHMIVIIGAVVVVGCVLGGFVLSGGAIAALIHPAEFLTIGGAALGGLIIGSPKKVLIDLVKALVGTLKGSPFGRPAYEELFKCLYDLLRTARRDGMRVLESHVADPHNSAIFTKYPMIGTNHHIVDFICGAMAPLIESTAKPEQLAELLEIEMKVIEEELPGFGIVAAVMGIVVTMGHIDGPPSEIGHMVGAALVGTFLGILMSYGFAAPLVARLVSLGQAEMGFFRTIASIIVGFADNLPPKVAIDLARRGVASEFRPTRNELDDLFKEAEAA
jgi:chemotaxis protein MotA